MRVLVTGSSGFLGRHLVEALQKDERFTHVHGCARGRMPFPAHHTYLGGLGYYLENNWDAQKIVTEVCPDVIFHLAADPNIRPSRTDPDGLTLWAANVRATHNLLMYAPQGCRFLLASSAAVYGDLGEWKACDEDSPTVPTSLYGATKLASEGLVHAYTAMGRVRGACLRLVANVGVGATHGALPDIVHKARSTSDTLELLGDFPGSVKPYIHVEDTVKAFILLALNEEEGNFNVSTDKPMSIFRLAWTVQNQLGTTKPVNWLGKSSIWRGDNLRVHTWSAKIRGLGWAPTCPTSELAIQTVVQELMREQEATPVRQSES